MSSQNEITLPKIAFWSIVIVAIAYAIARVLSLIDAKNPVSPWLMQIAVALMAIVVLFKAYSYVRTKKDVVWHIIYWVSAIIVIVCIIWAIFP